MSKVDQRRRELVVYLPDTRGVTISRFGKGNLKLGPDVFTYSRLPGRGSFLGTCPGSTNECERVCYAKRVAGPVHSVWYENSLSNSIPEELPEDCTLLRLHVGGDFTTPEYIDAWTNLLQRNPAVTCWAYTRSWRVPELLPALERLRALPNVQLFASLDKSNPDLPPEGWRRAWIITKDTLRSERSAEHNITPDGQLSYVCPEQTERKSTCQACGYCFAGSTKDVSFMEH